MTLEEMALLTEEQMDDLLTNEEIAQKRATLIERARVAKREWDALDKRDSRGGEHGLESVYASGWVKAALKLAAFVIAQDGIPDERD